MMPHLLVCTVPEMLDFTRQYLGTYYYCTYCVSSIDACTHFNDRPDAVICDLHFDDGKLFKFLQYLRAHPHTKTVPVVVSQLRSSLTPAMLKGIETALHEFGNVSLLNMGDVGQNFADEVAAQRLLVAIDVALRPYFGVSAVH